MRLTTGPASAGFSLSASGRKQPLALARKRQSECPLSEKADIRRLAGTVLHINARFQVNAPAPDSNRETPVSETGRYALFPSDGHGVWNPRQDSNLQLLR